MKKLMLLLISMLGVMLSSAQGIHLGVRGGLNFSYVNGYEELAGNDLRVGYHMGIYGDIIFSERISLEVDLLFSTQGATYEDDAEFEDGETIFYTDDEIKVDYINVPVLFKFYPVKGFSLQAGPQVGFLLEAVNTYKENNIAREDDLEEFVNNTDFGFVFGIGYKMNFGLNIDVRYVHGLSNVLSDDSGIDEDLNNQVVQISLGYSILH